MDDFVLNVRQIGSYPFIAAAGASDAFLLQSGGLGGAYQYTNTQGIAGALIDAKFVPLQQTVSTLQDMSTQLAQTIATTQSAFTDQIQAVVDQSVWTFNCRRGNIQLTLFDICDAGGAPIRSPNFVGEPTVPNIQDLESAGGEIANAAFVQAVVARGISQLLDGHPFVVAFNGRTGDVCLTLEDVEQSLFSGRPTSPTPPAFDHSLRIANTRWVRNTIESEADFLHDHITDEISKIYAPIRSPHFKGVPTAPEPAPLEDSNQIATTEWVRQLLTAIGAGVLTWNGRSGYVDLELADVTGVGGAPILSPNFTGTPTAITPAFTDNSTRLATTAFVRHAVDNSVTSFNTRIGDVVLTLADILGAGGQPITKINTTAPTAVAAGEFWFDANLDTTKFWDGSHWVMASRPYALVSSMPPINPHQGLLWFDQDDAELYVWYENGTSDQWVVAAVGSGTMGEMGPIGPVGPVGPQGDPGSSISIQGTLASTSDLPATGSPGDAWIIGGDLWIWSDATQSWQDVPLNISTDDGTF